jgi:P27 family predicted phage terminase small subunit
MRGRKPKPLELQALHGNPGKRKRRRAAPKSRNILADTAPPSHLRQDAARVWVKTLKACASLRMVTATDLGLFEAWCIWSGDVIQAERALKRRGPVAQDRDKIWRRNPWLLVRNRALDGLKQLAGEFGFSPSARLRLGEPLQRPDLLPAVAGDDEPVQSLKDYLAEGRALQ